MQLGFDWDSVKNIINVKINKMKRVKRHKIKYEKPEASSSYSAVKEEHDLAYYIHDRVELMHQVFSVLKAKDLRAIAPECVRKLSIDDLEELCTEELLGISSKRLLAILDGADPPSDTESSSQSSMEPMETISLDSISSDEEILSHGSRRKHKHKRRSSKSKKHKKKAEVDNNEDTEKSKASRAGLTVLELLELQARARAIRAQLQQEQANKKPEAPPVSSADSKSSDSEVEIKEEAAEVVEISSDDEKPKVEELEKALTKTKETNKEPEKSDKNSAANVTNTDTNNKDNDQANNKSKKKKDKSKNKNKRKDSEKEERDKRKHSETERREEVMEVRDKNETTEVEENDPITTTDKQTVTKRVNDLIITVPQSSTRKIKLNRNKVTVSVNNDFQAQNNADDTTNTKKVVIASTVTKAVNSTESANKRSSVVIVPRTIENTVKSVVVGTATGKNVDKEKSKGKDKTKSKAKKAKKKQKRQSIDEDQDEITIQLSDSEKMDLLEDFDSKKYDKVSSSSEDSESSSESSDSDSSSKNSATKENNVNEGAVYENDTIDINTQGHEVQAKVTDEIQTFVTDNEVDNETSSNHSANTEKDPTAVTKNGNLDSSNGIEPTETECQKDKHDVNNKNTITSYISVDNDKESEQNIEITNIDDIPVVEDAEVENDIIGDDSVKNQDAAAIIEDENKVKRTSDNITTELQSEECENTEAEKAESEIPDIEQDADVETTNNTLTKEMSEGELSSNESSEVEAFEVRPEVISISDEEMPKKKKKKEKKSKKEKASNFRERGDQNFYKETDKDSNEKNGSSKSDEDVKDIIVILDDDNVMEVYELSDDSSCYEVEGTVLSKEPTVEEIAALSAKIDEIEKEEADTRANEETVQIADENALQRQKEIESETLDENISWKDRYLGSAKVKKVLTTSNIFNVLRKKNKELKRKLEASKHEQKTDISEPQPEEEIPKPPENLVEGSIEHYNTLQGSNKYVNPVPDPEELKAELAKKLKEQEEIKRKEIEDQITGEMKKDAKQLLKMYKKLLKYNDVSKQKQKDPNKKKNKKRKKKEKEVATS